MDESSGNFEPIGDGISQPQQGGSDSQTSPFETELPARSASNSSIIGSDDDKLRNKFFVECCYLSLAAMLGCLMRIGLAQLFGDECANPGTVGWLSSGSPLCVTKNGEATREGGIVFADLPANMFGSFVMGFLQDATVLGLAVPMAVAWLRPNHPFQCMDVLHLAFRTGFCGSLTTFSSWNSEMIVVMFGTGADRTSQLFRAILGYIIGMESAMGSFACGKSFAKRCHRWVNPTLAAEAKSMHERQKEGVYMNRHLPDFERRFLADLKMGEDYDMLVPVGGVDSLRRWRQSTENARRVGHRHLPTLIEIENSELVHYVPASPQAEALARSEGWDVDGLQEWVLQRKRTLYSLPSMSSAEIVAAPISRWFTAPFAGALLSTVVILLMIGLLVLNSKDATTITDRTMIFSMLVAPFGALLRWRLSKLNQKLPIAGWKWFPFGTFLANFLGSVVSIFAVSLEYKVEPIYESTTFWTAGTVRAIKIGFAGCLTTVSTFVAEVSAFMANDSSNAYPYMITTLGICSAVSAILYGSITVFA